MTSLRERYHNDHGLIAQCCRCHMVRRPEDPTTWDEVPAFLQDPPDELTHGLCPTCFHEAYPEIAARYDAWVATRERGGIAHGA